MEHQSASDSPAQFPPNVKHVQNCERATHWKLSKLDQPSNKKRQSNVLATRKHTELQFQPQSRKRKWQKNVHSPPPPFFCVSFFPWYFPLHHTYFFLFSCETRQTRNSVASDQRPHKKNIQARTKLRTRNTRNPVRPQSTPANTSVQARTATNTPPPPTTRNSVSLRSTQQQSVQMGPPHVQVQFTTKHENAAQNSIQGNCQIHTAYDIIKDYLISRETSVITTSRDVRALERDQPSREVDMEKNDEANAWFGPSRKLWMRVGVNGRFSRGK